VNFFPGIAAVAPSTYKPTYKLKADGTGQHQNIKDDSRLGLLVFSGTAADSVRRAWKRSWRMGWDSNPREA
jgi:hypothetical protein